MVTLVYPEHADISQRKVSVLTPVGTALIGLRAGDSITWQAPDGQRRQLTVFWVAGPSWLDTCIAAWPLSRPMGQRDVGSVFD